MDDTIEVSPSKSAAQATQKQTGKPALASFDEDPAYLLFHYPSTVAREDRVIFSEGGLLAEINIMFMNMGIENISSRQISIRAETVTGPVSVHGFSKAECRKFIDTYDCLVIDGKDGNGAEAQGIMEAKMRLTILSQQLGISEPGEYRSARAVFQSQHGGWLCVYLTSEQLDMQVSIYDVKTAIQNLRSAGGHRLSVTRPVRPQAKIESPDGKGMLPLGDTVKGNRFNFGVYPAAHPSGETINMAAFEWPRLIPVTKDVEFKGEIHQYNTLVHYAIGGDSLIDRAATVKAGGEVKMLVCGHKKGCKKLMSICRGSCAIRRQQSHQLLVSAHKRLRDAEGKLTAEQRKQARAAQKTEEMREHHSRVREAHSAAFGPRSEPRIDNPCPHLAKGKCARGMRCKFSHDHLSTEAIKAIHCQVTRVGQRTCGAGVGCIYFHPDPEPESLC